MATQRTRPGHEVLVVEDDRRLLRAIGIELSALGLRNSLFENASEAMGCFVTRAIDLVITDLMLPGIDGFSVVGFVRTLTDVPIIVLTGHGDKCARFLASYTGIHVLTKPYDCHRLRKCIQHATPNLLLPPQFAAA